jgi:hypothetical protein
MKLAFSSGNGPRLGFRNLEPVLEEARVNTKSLPSDAVAKLDTFMEILDVTAEKFNSKRLYTESVVPGVLFYNYEKGCPKLSLIQGLKLLEELTKADDPEVLRATYVAMQIAAKVSEDFGVFDPVFLYLRQRDCEIISRINRIDSEVRGKVEVK